MANYRRGAHKRVRVSALGLRECRSRPATGGSRNYALPKPDAIDRAHVRFPPVDGLQPQSPLVRRLARPPALGRGQVGRAATRLPAKEKVAALNRPRPEWWNWQTQPPWTRPVNSETGPCEFESRLGYVESQHRPSNWLAPHEPLADFQTDRRRSARDVGAHPVAERPCVPSLWLRGGAYEGRRQSR